MGANYEVGMAELKLSERKQRILRALVDSYIINPEPISSNEIKNKYLPDVSSATIRNEMLALEEMGYLQQPHVSAGRVPSTKAYRYYVDNVLTESGIKPNFDDIRAHFNVGIGEVEEVMKNTAKVISDLTNYTSIVIYGGVGEILLKEIKLVDIGENSALVVIITDRGVIRDKVIDMPDNLSANYFVTANEMLNDIFAGKRLSEIIKHDELINSEIEEFKLLFEEVMSMLENYKDVNEGRVYLDGTEKIFDYKEYENIDNVKNFLSVINTKDKLNELVGNDDFEFSVKIGKDESGEENIAVVSAKCVIGGKEIARAGVIGPERMDYKKVIGVLQNIVSIIEKKE